MIELNQSSVYGCERCNQLNICNLKYKQLLEDAMKLCNIFEQQSLDWKTRYEALEMQFDDLVKLLNGRL